LCWGSAVCACGLLRYSMQGGEAVSGRAAGAAGLVAAAAAAAGAAALLAAVPLWFCIACPVCGHAAALVLLCLLGAS